MREPSKAVECALQIFQRFHGFLDKPAYTRFQGTPQSLALGAGLAVGDAFVGSFHNPRMALDFTALGVAANDAGKLQSCARPAKMLEWVQRSQTDRELVLELGGPAGRAGTGLTPVESSNLTGTAGLLRTCFALADPSFADAVAEVVRDRPVSAYRIRSPEEGTPTPRQGDRYVWIVVPRPSSGPE